TLYEVIRTRQHSAEAKRIQEEINRKKVTMTSGNAENNSNQFPTQNSDEATSNTAPALPPPTIDTTQDPTLPITIPSVYASQGLRPKEIAAYSKRIPKRGAVPPSRRQILIAMRNTNSLNDSSMAEEDGQTYSNALRPEDATSAYPNVLDMDGAAPRSIAAMARQCSLPLRKQPQLPKKSRNEFEDHVISRLLALEESREQWMRKMEERREARDQEREERLEAARLEREERERKREEYRDKMDTLREQRAARHDDLMCMVLTKLLNKETPEIPSNARSNSPIIQSSPWLYQSLPLMSQPKLTSERPMYLNAASLKSLFKMDSPGFQSAKHPFSKPSLQRRKRLHNVEALTKPPSNRNQTDDKQIKRKKISKKRARPEKLQEITPPPQLTIIEATEEEQLLASQMGLTIEEYRALEEQFSGHTFNQDEITTKYRAVFNEYDVDKSGSISAEELKTLLLAMGEEDLDDAEINDIIQQADADNNGAIEFDEFINMMKARKRLLAVAQHVGVMSSTPKAKGSTVDEQELPPLKVSTLQSKRHLKQYNRFISRPTPNCLRPGARVDVTMLRRELALSEYGLKELDMKVREDVQWVQANCPVTSLKAQLFCQKWGAEKMNKFFSRILLNFQARAFYKWIDFITFLAAKIKADKYLKCKAGSRLNTLMHSWKHKSMAKAWFAWSDMVTEQAHNEKTSCAMEIQRIARGMLVRVGHLHHLQDIGAISFQRLVRGHIARVHVKKFKRDILENKCASLLQRCYRGFAGRRLGRQLFRIQAQIRGASVIQAAFRAYQQCLLAREILNAKKKIRASTRIQCASRRKLAYLEAARRRCTKREIEATKDLQRCVRGWLGRLRVKGLRHRHKSARDIQRHYKGFRGRRMAKRVRQEKSAKRLAVRRERAALRIQAYWRGVTGRYAYHLRMRAKREYDHQLAAQREQSALKLQCLYRGYKARVYCNQLDVERALRRRKDLQNKSALKVQKLYRGWHGRRISHLRRQAKLALDREENQAAIKIQCLARSKHARTRVRRIRLDNKRKAIVRRMREQAATQIQAGIRGHWGRKKAAAKKALYETNAQAALAKLVRQTKEDAAIRIQCCARGYLSRERYRARLREHKLKLANLERHQREANAAIRIQCILRKKKATKLLAQRRAQFQKRIAMLASEKANDEIARLRREQEQELAKMKMQLILEKEMIEKEAKNLKKEVELVRLQKLDAMKDDEKAIATEKLTSLMQAAHTEDALERLKKEREAERELEQKRRELDLERARLASVEERQRREKEEATKQAEENAHLLLGQSMIHLEKIKSLEIARMEEQRLKLEKKQTIEATKRIEQERAALKIQAFVRAQLGRRKLKRIQAEQKRQLDAIKDVQERAILKAKLEKEEAKRRLEAALAEEERAHEQEERELQLLLAQKQIREKQRIAERKAKDVAARKIQALGKGYLARQKEKEMKRKIQAEQRKREKELQATLKAMEEAAPPTQDEWVEYWDENAQASYFFNIRTQEASWTKPGHTNAKDVAAQLLSYSSAISTQDYTQDNYGGYYKANETGYYDENGQYQYYDENGGGNGDGWAQYIDEASGAAYYYNHYTGERYWA
ncbi:hypothetical protein THRCLA_03243, partial [Thraustotheca clavata]